jgi:hypothetical protein
VRREGRHEALISLETFEINQHRLAGKVSTVIRKDVRDEFELRRLINCGECKHKLTSANSRSKTGALHPYYKCCNRYCSLKGKVIRADEIHSAFYKLLQSINPSPDIMGLAFAIFEDAWKTWLSKKDTEKNKLDLRKKEIEDSISKISNLASSPNINEIVLRQYEKQIEKLATELESIEHSLSIKEDYIAPKQTSSEQVQEALKNPYTVWIFYDTRKKQRFFSFIFEDNLVYSKIDGFQTPNYSLPIRVFQAMTASDPVHVEMGGSEPSCIQ